MLDPIEQKIALAISESPLFSTLENNEIHEIARQAERQSFSPKEFIIHEGDIASGFFLIIEGQVEVTQGRRYIRKMGRGQFFGETVLVENESRSADVIALEPTMCWKFTTTHLRELIGHDSQIAIKLLGETVRRNRANSTETS